MKRLVGVVVAITALAILVVVAFLMLFDADKYRPQIEAQVSKALNRDVKIGKASLRIYPFSIKLNDLAIAEAPGFQQGKPFAFAQQVFAKASLFALISGKPQVDSLELDQPQIQLVRDVTGKWNFASLGRNGASSNSNAQFSLGQLKIEDGVVTVIDLKQNAPAATYDHIDVTVDNFRADRQFPVTLSVHLPGKGAESLHLDAKVGPLNSASPALTPVDGQFDLKEVSFAELGGVTRGPKSEIDGTVNGHGTIQAQQGIFSSGGNLAFDHVTAHGVAIGFPIHIDFKIGGNLQQEVFQLTPVDLTLDKTHFQVSGVFDASHFPNTVNLDVKSPPASIAELAKIAGAFGASTGIQATGTVALNINVHGVTGNPGIIGTAVVSQADLKIDSLTKPVAIHEATVGFQNDAVSVEGLNMSIASTNIRGNVSAKNLKAPNLSFALSADKINVAELEALSKTPTSTAGKQDNLLTKMTGSGTLDAGTIVASGLVVTQVHSGVQLDRGVIRLSPLTATIFNGKETGTVVADLRPARPEYTVQVGLNGVDANALLTEVSAAKNTLSGLLNAKTDVQFTIPPDGDLMKKLNGTLGFSLANGQLKNIDLVNELGKIAKFTGAPVALGNTTLIKRLSGDLRFTSGIASTSNLIAEIPQGSLSGTGTINLVNQLLDMKANAVLASGPSKSFGGTSIGGFMTTALANRNGELVIPALVRGTLSKPVIEPDLAALARMRLSNLLPTSSNPGALTIGLLGALGNKGGAASTVQGILGALNEQQPAGSKADTPQSKAEGILGGFLKGLSNNNKKKTEQ